MKTARPYNAFLARSSNGRVYSTFPEGNARTLLAAAIAAQAAATATAYEQALYLDGPALLTMSGNERTAGTAVTGGSVSNTMYYDSTRAYNGSQSIKCDLSHGQPPATCGGSVSFGGRFNLPTLIPEGHNVWFRARFYIPSTVPMGYCFSTSDTADAATCGKPADGGGSVKWLVMAPDTGTARLYLNLRNQRRAAALNNGAILYSEAQPATPTQDTTTPIPLDQWFTLEMHVYLSSAADGGFVRGWINDTYIGQHTKATLANAAYKLKEWGLGDYWNGVPWTDGDGSRTNSFWMDDVIVASDYAGYGSPLSTDSGGRPRIGTVATVGDVTAPIFWDDFSSNNLTKTMNGISWLPSSHGSTATTGDNVEILSGAGNPGHGIVFTYGGNADTADDAWAEQRFDLGVGLPELTFEWDLYIPDGTESYGGAAYTHRNVSPSNNKLMAIWCDGTDGDADAGPGVIWEMWDDDAGGCTVSVHWSENNLGAGAHQQYTQFIVTPDDRGRWMTLRMYVKTATARVTPVNANSNPYNVSDGVIKMWRKWEDESSFTLFHSVTTANVAPIGGGTGFRWGYFMGWSNSGFTDTTKFVVDNVRVIGAMPWASYSAGVLTLSGTFPSKTTAAPLYFDDYESRSAGAAATTIGLESLGGDGTVVAVSTARAYTGTKSLRGDYATGDAGHFPRIGIDGLSADQIYVSCNLYWERYATGTSNAAIYKLCRAGSGAAYSGQPQFYETIRPDFTSGEITGIDRGYVQDDGTANYLNTNSGKAGRDGWHRLEYRYKLSTPGSADGALQTYVDLTANANSTNIVTRQTGSTAQINWVITPFDGMDHRGFTDNAYYVYVDNLYIDTTPVRVEVGNASTLAACTERVVAVPTAWSTTSITANLNTASLGSGTRWVYVFDANNEQYGSALEVTL